MRRISSNGGHHHHHHHLLLLLLLLLILSVHSPALASRLLRPVPDPAGGLKTIEGLRAAQVLPEEDSWKWTGMEEECKEGNFEECEKRRMMDEAHLDYIYTQHHRKP